MKITSIIKSFDESLEGDEMLKINLPKSMTKKRIFVTKKVVLLEELMVYRIMDLEAI